MMTVRLLLYIVSLYGGLMVGLAMPLMAQQTLERIVPHHQGEIQYSFAPVAASVAPSIVNIYASKIVESRRRLFRNPLFEHFFGGGFGFDLPSKRVENSLGSGIIVDAQKGLIITNNHVIEDASAIKIVLQDRREFEAKRILSNAKLDLAILRLEGAFDDITQAKLGNPDDLQVGDLVLAIGNPFGVGQTVTSGIISGLARTGVGVSDLQSFIQTDAAINPGNSGGALVSMQGEVIGINTAIFSRSGGSQGIGFAIPVNLAKIFIDAARQNRQVAVPWFGLKAKIMDYESAKALGLKQAEGILIEALHPYSPLRKAGLKAGDIITHIDEYAIYSPEELNFRALLRHVGHQAKFRFLRRKQYASIMVGLESAPQIPKANPVTIDFNSPLQGAILANLSPFLAQRLDLPDDESGVVVQDFHENASAMRAGFKIGDMILAINRVEIADTTNLKRLFNRLDTSQRWEITIKRQGRVQRFVYR